jgi:hypothetical protein
MARWFLGLGVGLVYTLGLALALRNATAPARPAGRHRGVPAPAKEKRSPVPLPGRLTRTDLAGTPTARLDRASLSRAAARVELMAERSRSAGPLWDGR